MTASPYDLRRTYTVEQFAALPEDESARYELQDGLIVMNPNPSRHHMLASYRLFAQLEPQMPDDLFVVGEVDVDLQLPSPVVRIPDMIIGRRGMFGEQRLTTASDLLLVVEILSPTSLRTDRITKMADYADAGIGNYWIIDPEPPVTVSVYRLADGAYAEEQRDVQGTLTVSQPCELTVDLNALLPE